MRSLRKLGLAITACLVFAIVAPLFFAERRMDDTFAISAVNAAPRDLHVLTVPVQLSTAPDLTLMRTVVYDFGPGPGGPGQAQSQVLLEGPVFTLNAGGRRTAAAPAEAEAADAHGPLADADAHAATDGPAADAPAAAGATPAPPPAPPQEPMSPLLQQLAGLAFDLIAIRRGTLHITLPDGSTETISDIQAEVRKGRAKGQYTSLGSFTVRGQRLAFDATFSQPADKLATRWPLQVTFKAGLLQGSFDGDADLGEDLQLRGQTELSTPSLRAVGRWFGLPLYMTDGFNATTVKGELAWARRSLAFEKVRVAVDENEGNGRLALNLGGDRPLIEATLDFATLNLTPYVDAARTQFFGFELPGSWWSSFDISLPMIRHLDADMRISARRVTLKDYALGQGGATITAQAGKLHADITELELPWGTLSAQVTAIMSEAAPRYALRAKIENLETAPVSALLLHSSALSGRATLALDLTSTGYSLTEVTRRLSGKAALVMPEGGRMALDLKAARAAAKAGARGWAQLAKAHTSLDRLEVRALIIDGVAFADEVHARAGDTALVLGGRLGLVDGNMDARLMMKANVPPGQSLRLSDAGGETLTLRGPWSRPDVRGEDGEASAFSREGRAP